MRPPPWSGPQRGGGGKADPGVCSGPTALMIAVMGTVGGGRFPTPTPRVSAEEAEKWPCTWARGTLERTRSLEPKRLGVAVSTGAEKAGKRSNTS